MTDLKKNLHTALKNEFWEDFLDAFSEEFNLLETEILKKKDFLNSRENTDIDSLLSVIKSYGGNIDRSVDDSLNFIKNNIDTLTNRIKYKTTYAGYHYIFSLINMIGKVYNYYIYINKYTRRIDESALITAIDAITNFNTPFLEFNPEVYYKSPQIDFTLDQTPTEYLDDYPVITLDSGIYQQPTVHLAVEFVPFNLVYDENSNEFIINKTYLDYLFYNVILNKKTTEIPHTGIQLNCFMDFSGYYDNLSNSNYSLDALKLNCAVVNFDGFYSALALDIPTGQLGNMDLDLTGNDAWYLDKKELAFDYIDINDTFYKLEIGDSTKGLPSKNYTSINDALIAFWNFSEGKGSTFKDYTQNHYNGTLKGSFSWEQSVIGGGIKFLASNSGRGSTSNIINISPNEQCLSFWVKGLKGEFSANVVYLLTFTGASPDTGSVLFNVAFDRTTDTIIINSYNGVGLSSLTYNLNIFDNQNYLITLLYDEPNDLLSLYINGILKTSKALSAMTGTLPVQSLYKLNICVLPGFQGFIDDIRVYNRLLSSNEILYLYNSRLGEFQSLANKLPYERTNNSIIKKINDTNWFIITARLDFYEEMQAIIDISSDILSDEQKAEQINILKEEVVSITEVGIKDINDSLKIYASFPTIEIKKRDHISFQFFIKKTT